ncbi:phosphoribosyltransferase [Acidianus infernus]|uniref:Phosphoribosyltransferase n=1 Tax=Acidianus infernus TaxID=12915 RepID=A0A6A9QBE8_ACIIN|nr:phosphoribosyltransferase family protein [Acidianus infernus]MCY0874076.1 phosphoribosyltransferase family protein [Acidianus infernus]MCY0883691.1 phosphoribosyltransferase family protein [Acidianus infernus]MUM64521.1 phosphoribosyltransferase [Acidianus infernus]
MIKVSKDKEIRNRLLAIDILRELKNSYTYRELSEIFGIQETLICRYVNGNTVPSDVQSMEIISKVKNKEFLLKFFRNKIKVLEDGYIDSSQLLLYPNLLKLLLELYLTKVLQQDAVDKIFSIATNGVPFATIASLILDKPLLIAKKHKDSINLEYYEESLKETDSVVNNIYLRKDLIRKNDRILIVDDVIKSGKTISSSIKLLQKAGARVVGILVLVGNLDNIKYLKDENIQVIFNI